MTLHLAATILLAIGAVSMACSIISLRRRIERLEENDAHEFEQRLRAGRRPPRPTR